ncbi:MAG: DUF6320 domain-containing protein [Hespellia sp.]|nr:DUF6320 domain-containing protein [Hespellia sp.]
MPNTKRAHWRNLDNAAKVFPATSNKNDTRVFRFYCLLKEQVQEDQLQRALDKTLEKYPVFLSVLRKGLFWHYLEKSELRPVVCQEKKSPCSSIYVRDKKKLLFEVTYYKNRINFEVFHALTDGSGATEFLRELVKQYLLVAHQQDNLPDVSLLPDDITIPDQENDGFNKYYSKDIKGRKKKKEKAHVLKGTKHENMKLHVTETTVSVKALLAKAREYGVSMTVFLTAVYLCAIHAEMTKAQERKLVRLMVPVNLRNFFPSSSMLNFFWWIEPEYRFREGEQSFRQVLESVKEYFKTELTAEKMAENMSQLVALEHHPLLRFAPLELKNRAISAGTTISKNEFTAIFSNMSVVKMPQEYLPYIERFGVYTSTPQLELCMCSFQDTITFGFTSRFDTTNVQRNFFRILKEEGIDSEEQDTMLPEEEPESAVAITFYKWFTFLCLVSVVVSVVVAYSLTTDFQWALWVAGGVASMWLALTIGFFKRHNLLKNAMWQLLVITIGCFIWDNATGWRGWSVNFVLPGVSVLIEVSMLVISKLQSHSAREYMIYYVMATTYGMLLPLILLLTKVVTVTFACTACVGISFLFLMALVIFRWKEFKEEMHKKFHYK